MLDFEVKQEIIPVIQVNFEEMKQALSNTMEQYKGIIVTEESLSACKAEQKHLASIRTKIDNYRKEKKKELSKPISDFESQCKELINLIEKAEQPIKEGISVFDNKKREEKRQKALEIIQVAIEAHQLKKKFADRLTVLDKYMNLTASTKSIKEDVEQRAFILINEQAKEEEVIQIIKTTIENENKNIKTPIKYEDFVNLVDSGYPIPKIIERINQMAEKIRLAENPIKEEPKKDIQKLEIQKNTSLQVQGNISLEPEQKEQLYYVEFKIIGNKFQTAQLGKFLRDNNFNYEVLNKGAVE